MRFAIVAALLTLAPSARGLAQNEAGGAEASEAEATELRRRGQEALEQGRFGEAYGLFTRASAGTADPGVWLDIGNAADRLRMNARALAAYERYLERRADAPDRASVEAQIRVLRQILEGARYVEAENGANVRLIHDWEGEPSLPNPPGRGAGRGGANILVDWAGRPLEGRRTRDMLALADWDGVIRNEGAPEPTAPPPPQSDGLGRLLATP